MSSPAPSRLQQEIQQTVPFESVRAEALLGILHTADLIHRRTARFMEPFGITPQQYNVLRILRGAGSAGLPTLDITDRMIEQAPGITRMIDRLEAKKFVTRERSSEDRRQVLCRITQEGLKLLGDLDVPLRDQSASLIGEATDQQLAALVSILDTIRAAHSE